MNDKSINVHRVLAAGDRSHSQDGFKANANFNSESTNLWQPKRVLTLDGNGSQGLFSLYVLEALMNKVEQIEKQLYPPASSSASSPLWRVETTLLSETSDRRKEVWQSPPRSYRPCHYFDYITGASTGGMIAVMLGVKRLTVAEAINHAEKIFDGLASQKRRKNSRLLTRNLQRALEEDVSRSARIPFLRSMMFSTGREQRRTNRGNILEGDTYGCRTMVFTTHKASSGNEPYLFRSYRVTGHSVLNAETQTWEAPIIDTCRASLAYPGCFNSVEVGDLGTFRDADVLDIDPALETYNELEQINGRQDGNFQCFLSIGTGVSCSGSERNGKLSMRYNEYPTRSILERNARKHKFRYERICWLDEVARPSKDLYFAANVRQNARACMPRLEQRLETWALELVHYRRNRAQTMRWELYVSLRIACPFCSEKLERDHLINHLGKMHADDVGRSQQSRTV